MRRLRQGLLLVSMMSLALSSCKEDPCKEVECLNGLCSAGTCACDPGYEGSDCGTLARDKFLHTNWYNSRTCPGVSDLMISKVIAGDGAVDEIWVINLDTEPDTIAATVRGDTVLIPLQVHGVEYLEGKGIFSEGDIVIEYDRVLTGGQRTNCIAHFSR